MFTKNFIIIVSEQDTISVYDRRESREHCVDLNSLSFGSMDVDSVNAKLPLSGPVEPRKIREVFGPSSFMLETDDVAEFLLDNPYLFGIEKEALRLLI